MNHGASRVPSKNMKLLFSAHPSISCFKNFWSTCWGRRLLPFFFKLLPFRFQWLLGTKHKESQEVTVPDRGSIEVHAMRVIVQCFFGSGGQRPIHV